MKHCLPVPLKSWRQREPTAGAALADTDLAGHDPTRCSLQSTTDETRTSPTLRFGCADIPVRQKHVSRTTQRLGTFVVHLHSPLHRQQQHGHVVTSRGHHVHISQLELPHIIPPVSDGSGLLRGAHGGPTFQLPLCALSVAPAAATADASACCSCRPLTEVCA